MSAARMALLPVRTCYCNGGLAARTIGHAHRVLGAALSDAERDGAVVKKRLQASEGAQGL